MSSAATGEPLEAIAVIGMAGRFPGARDLSEYWDNLCRGVESITFFNAEELAAAGVDRRLAARPGYVPAKPVLDGVDLFDAEFFGVNPREAELMDPQQRLFLECAWEALEDAGYDPGRYGGWIGVFAGAAQSRYLLSNLHPGRAVLDPLRSLQLQTATDKDHLSTRVSYALDLRGPSITVQTACSTGLVAVDLARQSLLSYGCDLALAGGVAVDLPQAGGYLYQEGGILSPDGHCRAFDAEAEGTLFGSGVGLVVLKRLSEAQVDGDAIRAVIKGSAVNNDGAAKVGYTAPGVDGQAAVIAMAQGIAGVEPDTVGYVEAHGTGTPLGDQIEVEALTRAFRAGTERRGFCALGSVKTNIGHLETAAGAAGLIKTVLALEKGLIPPSLHCRQPNPPIGFEATPFFVPGEAIPWPLESGPRRAGVSSFGMGGTNAHAVLEQAPAVERCAAPLGAQLLLLSARTPSALEAQTARLGAHLERHPELSLADVAHTLAIGRQPFEYRRCVVATTVDAAVEALAGAAPERVADGRAAEQERPVVFLFPGQGAQHVGMARDLYQGQEAFRAVVDHCAELLLPELGRDLRQALFPPADDAAAEQELADTALAQPALFVVEYALATLLMGWGVKPEAMLGHSLGEIVAACLAGVITLPDALRLVVLRGRLMARAGSGAMLAVALGESEARLHLGDELDLAAVNAERQCVLSGPPQAIEELARSLGERGIEHHRLPMPHAFHSRSMDGAVEPLRAALGEIPLAEPGIPFLSNVSGGWITPAEATSAEYWARHLRRPVRFADGLAALADDTSRLLLEVGPGRVLSDLATAAVGVGEGRVLATLADPRGEAPQAARLLRAVGRLWLEGQTLDWQAFYGDPRRRRVPLPTYPFERRRYWIDPPAGAEAAAAQGAQARETAVEPAGAAAAAARAAGTASPGNGNAAAARRAGHRRPSLKNPYVAPRSDTEALLADLWQEVLGIAQVGVEDNFFDLGGHSLIATQLVGQVSEAFAIDLELSKLTEAPTVRAQAELVAGLEAERESRERVEVLELVSGLTDEQADAEIRRRLAGLGPPAEVGEPLGGREQEG